MMYLVPRHDRRTIRLPAHDYAGRGTCFVTIGTRRRVQSLGQVCDGSVRLSACGMIVNECLASIPDHHPVAILDRWVVMPDHMHGIIRIGREDQGLGPISGSMDTRLPRGPAPGSVGAIIGSFKAAVTKRVNAVRATPGAAFWQRNYYERLIRDGAHLDRVRQYIAENPVRWGSPFDPVIP